MTLGRESDTRRRSDSFHGPLPANSNEPRLIARPESHPELIRRRGGAFNHQVSPENGGRKLTKLLLNVTIQGRPGPIHVVMSPEITVADLIKAALETYAKEGRIPLLTETDPRRFELHYSPFSLESLNPKEKLIDLGSRNFFLCTKHALVNSCSNEATKASKTTFPCAEFMDILL